MELFNNLIYECKKGMRDMAMYTCKKEDSDEFIGQLSKNGIEFVVKDIGNNKINLFFGNSDCLEILLKFSSEKLNELTNYEDFVLGIMLGYSRTEQYKRFLKLNERACST